MRERQEQGCRIEDRISGKTDAPKASVINPRDDDLTCCKFEKLAPRALAVVWDQALRDEYDLQAPAVGGICDRIIVAHRPEPGTKDIQPLEGLTIYRHRSTPECLIPTYGECTWRELFEFTTRQIVITR